MKGMIETKHSLKLQVPSKQLYFSLDLIESTHFIQKLKKTFTSLKGVLGATVSHSFFLKSICNYDANTKELKRIYNLHSVTWNAPFTG